MLDVQESWEQHILEIDRDVLQTQPMWPIGRN